MALAIELLGPPRVERDGAAMPPPRGRKTWCLLAYLLLAIRPPSRDRLAELLFPEANDPLGALRWSLADLRRILGPECTVGGDPVVVCLPPTAVVDVALVRCGRWSEAMDVQGVGGELLEGVAVPDSAAFEIWLANERRRLGGGAEAMLHEAALTCLATNKLTEAAGHAARLVELNPLDEAHHVLLVQCLRTAGDNRAAADHVQRCTELFRQELGVEPSQALHDAAATPRLDPPSTSPHSVQAMLEAGESAVAAGAVSQGLQTLRAAAALARQRQDGHRLAQVLLALGHALVHLGKGGDEEGGAVLYEAAARAVEAGDDAELAWIESIDGVCLSDLGCYAQASAVLGSAAKRAERAGAAEAGIFAQTFIGRLHLLRGELAEAAVVLERALRNARASWIAWSPLPESFLAEVELRTGDVDGAEVRFERAFVMGRQLDDACLESIAARGVGLIAVARGQITRGYQILIDAPRFSRRRPDSYLWIQGYGLDALCTVAIEHGIAAGPPGGQPS